MSFWFGVKGAKTYTREAGWAIQVLDLDQKLMPRFLKLQKEAHEAEINRDLLASAPNPTVGPM